MKATRIAVATPRGSLRSPLGWRWSSLVRTTLLLAVLALLVGAGTVAAAPGNGNGNAPDDVGSDRAGPPTDLPGPVPDFVEEIHRTVGAFLDGSVDSLGSAVSDLTPDGEESAGSGSENAGA